MPASHDPKTLKTKPVPLIEKTKKATIDDWLKQPEELHAELINGKLVYESMPNLDHGSIGGWLASFLWDPYNQLRRSGNRLGGWWLSQDVDIAVGTHRLRPDLAGWRRERYPTKPQAHHGAVTDVPDWVAEVLSPSTMGRDWKDKRRIYHEFKVPHYWLLDPINHTLTTLIWSDGDYKIGCFAGLEDIVTAEPFGEVQIPLRKLFGIEESSEEAKASEPQEVSEEMKMD